MTRYPLLKVCFSMMVFSAVILSSQIRIFSRESVLPFSSFKLEEYLSRPKIALTFDDGPHPYYTYQILDILEREGAKATFFVVGKQVEKHPDLLQAIDYTGNEVENHTFHHFKLTSLSPEEIISELKMTEDVIYKTIGKKPYYFRPPGGHYDSLVVRTAREKGEDIALWTVSGNDTDSVSSQNICTRIIDTIDRDGIILLHSGVENTLEALPLLIRELKKKGYRFVTLSDLDKGNDRI